MKYLKNSNKKKWFFLWVFKSEIVRTTCSLLSSNCASSFINWTPCKPCSLFLLCNYGLRKCTWEPGDLRQLRDIMLSLILHHRRSYLHFCKSKGAERGGGLWIITLFWLSNRMVTNLPWELDLALWYDYGMRSIKHLDSSIILSSKGHFASLIIPTI